MILAGRRNRYSLRWPCWPPGRPPCGTGWNRWSPSRKARHVVADPGRSPSSTIGVVAGRDRRGRPASMGLAQGGPTPRPEDVSVLTVAARRGSSTGGRPSTREVFMRPQWATEPTRWSEFRRPSRRRLGQMRLAALVSRTSDRAARSCRPGFRAPQLRAVDVPGRGRWWPAVNPWRCNCGDPPMKHFSRGFPCCGWCHWAGGRGHHP